MSTTIRLPRVAVSRELASSLVASSSVEVGDEITLDGRGLVVNNESFAFQLAEDLSDHKAATIRVVGGSPKWLEAISKAAVQFQIGVENQPVSLI